MTQTISSPSTADLSEANRAPETESMKSSARGTQNSRGLVVPKKRALIVLGEEYWDFVYPPSLRNHLASLVDFSGPPQSADSLLANLDLLADVEVIFTGWETIRFSEAVLSKAPRLEAVFHGAGSIKPFVSDAFWKREIVITSAVTSNAIPVAEYSLGTILLSLRHFWSYASSARKAEGWGSTTRPMPGGYQSKVGLVSLGAIGRRVLQLLKNFDLDVMVHCPYLSPVEAHKLGVTPASLETVFRSCDVVSLHTPVLPETIGLITGDLIASMKSGATLINTARGVIINEAEMVEVLRSRPDLNVVTDVTDPHEPPQLDSPLLQLPNVVVTPHIAGSHSRECARMGAYMLEELQRYLKGEPLRWAVTEEMNRRMA